jgi:hypothetical protein
MLVIRCMSESITANSLICEANYVAIFKTNGTKFDYA